ncbi:response regulator transcription factor [Nonomuraea sp. NPDC049625]|uniref:response regulator transcription factor n=1 Tax=Nonomuraea sp. NPDC049625 TaxID=3155775 RepID=UPI00342076E4
MLRVMIVDDHPIVREGLRGMLQAEPDLEVVGEAGSGDEAVVVVPRLRPDVILMDLRMPGGDGVSAIERLGPGHRVIVLTTYEDDGEILRAVSAGAAGYLLKDVSRADLASAVRAAAGGRTVLSPSVAARLAGRRPAVPVLSEREREVLELVGQGLTNGEIGRRLFIGEATVKTYLLRVYGKLGVSDRTSAVLAALDLGLVRRHP